MNDNEKIQSGSQLGFWGLTAVAIGMTVASGVFSLAGDFPKEGASQGAVIIGWIICGLGMFGLMRVFFGLSYVKPELKGGFYSFAQAGFGDWIGFISAWGYWVCCWVTLVAFGNLLFSSIGHFIPFFGAGNSGPSVICSSIYIWLLCALVLYGVQAASFVNIAITLAKMVPLFMFVLLAFLLGKFDPSIFLDNFWGTESSVVFDENLGEYVNGDPLPLLSQINGTSMITLWVFSGIEGAVVISARAKRMPDVAKASATSFFFVLVLYMFISLVAMGVLSGKDLANLSDPNLAYVMEAVTGPWGAQLINLGVIISLLGALLAVVIITGEIANAAAKMGSFCKFFEGENKKGSPKNSLILSTGLAQVLLISTYFGEAGFTALYYMSASMLMLPYLFCALYYAKVVKAEDGFETYAPGNKFKFEVFVAIIAVIYGVWLVYAAGLDYLLISSMFYAPGALVYIKGKKEKGEKAFTKAYDLPLLGILIVCGVLSVILIATQVLQPF